MFHSHLQGVHLKFPHAMLCYLLTLYTQCVPSFSVSGIIQSVLAL